MLEDGNIRGGQLRPNHAAETNWLTGVITVNRQASFGSTFDKPTELAHTLGHEYGHVKQAAGKGLLTRILMQARYGIDMKFTAAVERQADGYACEVGPVSHPHCQ
jgi:hypothetical protein